MSWNRKLAEWIKAQPWGYWVLSVLAMTVLPVSLLYMMTMMNSAIGLIILPVIPFFLGLIGTVHLTKKELSWMQAYLPAVGLFFVAAAAFLLEYASGRLSVHDYFDVIITLVVLVTLAANILCFSIGERIQGIKRKRPSVRQWIAVGFLSLAVAVTSEFLSYFRSLDTIVLSDTDPQLRVLINSYYNSNQSGYGWKYENGWSSVDLEPYYVENPDNLLPEIESSTFRIGNVENMPVLDGAEAAYPVYSAFANACYENIAEIQRTAKKNDAPRPIAFTNTVEAYKSLIAGDVDIFFGARPSQAQLSLAEEAGVELEMTPIGKEGFVFFVSEENPVDGLTSEQIRNIYSGKTNNWLFLGGGFKTILAFQRPENSGSQTMMQYFMGDVPMRAPLEYEYTESMVGVIRDVAEYQNDAASIGYSFRYYASQMVFEDSDGIKFLELDGVYPNEENIRNGSYPMTTELYAITVKGNENPNVKPFVEWMTGEQGQRLVMNTGYVTD